MAPWVKKVYGGPGTGKTRRLMLHLADEIQLGTEPNDIVFITFSRAATEEARSRALPLINSMSRGVDALRFFRTFHGLASSLLGLGEANFVKAKHRDHFAHYAGLAYDGQLDEAHGQDLPIGNRIFQLAERITNNRVPLTEWRRVTTSEEEWPAATEQLLHKWTAWKATSDLYDYADVLRDALAQQRELPPNVRVLFVDEFQDLSPLQHAVYRMWMRSVERVFIAGDDDQTIYTFQGANPRLLIDEPCDEEEVLRESTRLPSNILGFVRLIIESVSDRKQKHFTAARIGGGLYKTQSPDFSHLLRSISPTSTYFLARTNRTALRVADALRANGVPFSYVGDGLEGTWSAKLVHLRECIRAFYEQHDGSVPYAAALDFVEAMPSHHKTSGAGYVRHGAKTQFAKIVRDFPRLETPLGEDFKHWTAARLSPYFSVFPSLAEVVSKSNISDMQREALRAHLQYNPSWPMPEPERGVRVGTIHSSKGKQADVVVLAADVSHGAFRRMTLTGTDDDERRVFYVGATRAIHRLILAVPLFRDSPATFPLPPATMPDPERAAS